MWSWLAIGFSSLLYIQAERRQELRLSLLFKMVTMGLLAVLALTQAGSGTVSQWLLAGLMIFALGDCLSSLNKAKLAFVSFIVGQFCYSRMFWLQMNNELIWWLPALLFASCVVAFFLLLPLLDSMVFPVAIMGLVVAQLAWAAGEVWLHSSQLNDALGFLGALVLMFSALAKAIAIYKNSDRGTLHWVMGSYFLAHYLIVASQIV